MKENIRLAVAKCGGTGYLHVSAAPLEAVKHFKKSPAPFVGYSLKPRPWHFLSRMNWTTVLLSLNLGVDTQD